jgi:protein-S-isoprenylcysteine O-methyltransferase Ste14
MNNFQRIFGTGPRGLIISVVLLLLSFWVNPILNIPEIHGNNTIGVSVFGVAIILTILLIVWSAKSLNPSQRGRELVTSGAFRFFRHPLYAAFLTFFNFGLAIYLDNYIFIFWAILQHFVWHVNVAKEEKMISGIFPQTYDEYCKRTGRFFPRFW